MIRPAIKSDLAEIIKITKACASKMISENIFQWNESYPRLSQFEKDLENKSLYVYEEKDTIIGCVVISSDIDLEYTDVPWLTPSEHNYYVHRLAVHPSFQRQGIAKKMMLFAEKLSIENKILSIRLDTFSGNLKNQSFYASLGYKSVGNIYYPNQSELPFICYELVLHKD